MVKIAECELRCKKRGELVKTPHTEATEAISINLESGDASAVATNMTKTAVNPQSGNRTFGAEECWATVAGRRMRYLCCGSGSQLLLIHGLLGYSFSWRFNLAVLGQHATVYAPDLLGMGFSDRCPEVDSSMRAQAERLLRFMDEVGIAQADVVGTSHGGAVAMMLAAAHRERVRRLVLVAAVNPWSRYGRLLTRVLAWRGGAYAFRRIEPRLSRAYFLRRMYGDPRRIAPGTVEGYSEALDIPGTLQHGLAIVHTWHRDLRELQRALPKIGDIPALLVWGERDRAVLPGSAAKLAACFSNAKLVMLEGVGHLAYEEVPGEFNHIVIDYLNPASPTTADVAGREPGPNV